MVEQNLADENFGISQVLLQMGISRTQLHNKLKALTGKSTSRAIRSIRLQKAKELLVNTDLNISEVAYQVGFKDANYFSLCFSREYGETASELRKK